MYIDFEIVFCVGAVCRLRVVRVSPLSVAVVG